MMRCFQICCLMIMIYTPFVVSSELQDAFFEDIPHHRGKRAVDTGMEDAVRLLILNGLPSFGIPPLDPLFLDQLNISLPEIPGVVLANEFLLDRVNITGLSDFIANDLNANVFGLTLNFDLTFDVHAHADFARFDLLIGDMIPLYGDGTLILDVDDLRLNGSIKINSTSQVLDDNSTQFWVILKSIDADIDIGSTTFNISNIMNLGETKFATTFNRVMSETTPTILNISLETMKEDLIASIVALVNEQLNIAKITISQLLDLL